jgi:1-acyl-sn-glycerol-3-phosphate acyltransferase
VLLGFSILYWAFFCLTLPLGFLGALLVYVVTLPFDRRGRALHMYTCAWAMFYIGANPIWSLRVTGREKIPRRGAAVIVANHASLIDILVLFGLYRQFKWVSKASNFKLPIIGWVPLRLPRERRSHIGDSDDERVPRPARAQGSRSDLP